MALQLGGQISLSQITAEMGLISQNVSLTNLSTHSTLNDQSPMKPDESQPHAMSEFFAYDHSYSSFKSLSGGVENPTFAGKWFNFCGDDISSFYSHDGSNDMPEVGDTIYINNKGDMTPIGTSHVKLSGEFDEKVGSSVFVATTNSGTVISINSCEGVEDPKEPGPDEPVDPRLGGR